MVKEAKFFRRQAVRAETAARAASDAEISQRLLAMAEGYRSQASFLKKRRKKKLKKTKTKTKTLKGQEERCEAARLKRKPV
jgi:hypothetical protein